MTRKAIPVKKKSSRDRSRRNLEQAKTVAMLVAKANEKLGPKPPIPTRPRDPLSRDQQIAQLYEGRAEGIKSIIDLNMKLLRSPTVAVRDPDIKAANAVGDHRRALYLQKQLLAEYELVMAQAEEDAKTWRG